MQETSLKKRYSIKLFSNIVNGIINAVIVAIVPKALGPIAYGQFVYLQDFFLKFLGFLDMGSSKAFFTKLSANPQRKKLIIFYSFYSFFVLFIVIGLIYIIDLLSYTDRIIPNISIDFIYMGLFFGFFTWATQIFIKISDAYALTVSVELIKIAHKMMSLLLLLFFVYMLFFDLKSYFYFHYISLALFLCIILWLFIQKNIFSSQLLKFQNLEFKKLIKEFADYCHPLVIYSVVGLIAGLFDIWLLQNTAGSEQMGFYGLAYSLAAMCFLFTSAMTPIITREFSKSYEQNDIENMRKLFYRYIPMLYSVAAFFAVFISIQSENVLTIFTDEKFKDAFLVLVVMAFYPIHQTYGQLSGSIFYATGQTKLMRNIALSTMPLGILTTLVLIYLLDLEAVGLAYKMISIQFIGVNIQLYFNAKFLNLNIKYFILHQIYSILFFAILAFFSDMLINIESILADFLISGMFYSLLVVIFLYTFPQVIATSREEINLTLNQVYLKLRK